MFEELKKVLVEDIDVEIKSDYAMLSFYKKTEEEEKKLADSIHKIINVFLSHDYDLGNTNIKYAVEKGQVLISKYIFLNKKEK